MIMTSSTTVMARMPSAIYPPHWLETKTAEGGFKPVAVTVAADAAPGVYRLCAATEPYKFWSSTTPHGKHAIDVRSRSYGRFPVSE